MPKGKLDPLPSAAFQILLSLAGEDLHGDAIMRQVAEQTGAGATDVGVFHRIDEHFGIGLRESKVPNPYPAPDWAVHGVPPDISVPAAQALDTAETLARQQIAKR